MLGRAGIFCLVAWTTLAPLGALSLTGYALGAEPFLVLHEFHITEGGGLIEHTVPQLGTPEFQVLATAACTVFGVNCSEQAGQVRRGAEILSDYLTSKGENYLITGRITLQAGEEWRGVFDTFDGYEVCNAGLDYSNMGITGETTFNVTINRTGENQGLWFYAEVPKHRASGRQWVDARLVIHYVPTGTAAKYSCPPDRSSPWLCKGQNCWPLTRIGAVAATAQSPCGNAMAFVRRVHWHIFGLSLAQTIGSRTNMVAKPPLSMKVAVRGEPSKRRGGMFCP
jgi:hypothetical protein